jgi:c-di-GMP-binding flagellar brake protein YcgR
MEFDQAESCGAMLRLDSERDGMRAYRRLKCTGTAEILVLPDGPKATGTVVDLSLRGCCIALSSTLKAQAYARVEVQLCVRKITLKLAGALRHRQQNLRTGIEFINVSQRKEAQIQELIVELFEMDISRPSPARKRARA